jgi:hypothetical protein
MRDGEQWASVLGEPPKWDEKRRNEIEPWMKPIPNSFDLAGVKFMLD